MELISCGTMCDFELDEFKIGDRVKVIKNSGRNSRVSMIGEKGTVIKILSKILMIKFDNNTTGFIIFSDLIKIVDCTFIYKSCLKCKGTKYISVAPSIKGIEKCPYCNRNGET